MVQSSPENTERQDSVQGHRERVRLLLRDRGAGQQAGVLMTKRPFIVHCLWQSGPGRGCMGTPSEFRSFRVTAGEAGLGNSPPAAAPSLPCWVSLSHTQMLTLVGLPFNNPHINPHAHSVGVCVCARAYTHTEELPAAALP